MGLLYFVLSFSDIYKCLLHAWEEYYINFCCGNVTERVRWGTAAAQKPINRPDRWKGKFALFQMPPTWGGGVDICPKADSPHLPPPHTHMATSGARAFIARMRGLHAETAQPALTGIFRLVISGLTSVILTVLGTVSLQYQGPFVPIYLWPVLRIVTAHVLGIVWSSCSKLFHLCFGIYKTAHRIWLRILSIALEKGLKVLDYA